MIKLDFMTVLGGHSGPVDLWREKGLSYWSVLHLQNEDESGANIKSSPIIANNLVQ